MGIGDLEMVYPPLEPWSEFIDLLKSFFTEADFERWFGVATRAAEMFASALRSIPWDSIKSGARATAINLAGLLGGFTSNINLAKAIGETLAEIVNTVSIFLYEFANAFPWKETGAALAAGVNSIFDTWNPADTARAINAWALGLLDLLLIAVTETEWDKIGDKIVEFLNEIKWIEILTNVGKTVKEALKGALTTIATVFSSDMAIQPQPEDFVGPMPMRAQNQWALDIAKGLADGLNEVLADPELFEIAGETLTNVLDTLLKSVGIFISTFKWEEAGKNIGEFIKNAIDWVDENQDEIISAINGLINGILELISNADIPVDRILEIAQAIVGAIDFDKVLELIETIGEIKAIPGKILDVIGKEFIKAAAPEMFANIGKRIVKFLLTGLLNAILLPPPLQLIAGLVNLINLITGGALNDIISAGVNLIDGLFAGILKGLGSPGAWIKENIVDPILNAVRWLFGIQSPSTVFAEIGEFLIEGLLKGILDIFGSVAEFFGNIFDGLTEFFAGIFGDAWDAVTKIWSGITGFFGSLWDGIQGVFSGIGDWFGDKFTDAKDLVQGAFKNVKGFFSNRWGDIKDAFGGVKTWFGKTFKDGRTDIENEFEQNKVSTFFGGVWSSIKEVFNSNDFSDIGSNLMGGLKGGIESAREAVGNAARGVLDFVRNLISSEEDIHSPSRRWAKEIGMPLGQGVGVGFENAAKMIADSFMSVLEGIQDSASSEYAGFLAIGQKIGEIVSQGLQTAYDPIMSFLDRLFDGMDSKISGFSPRFNIPSLNTGDIIGHSALQAMANKGANCAVDYTGKFDKIIGLLEVGSVLKEEIRDILLEFEPESNAGGVNTSQLSKALWGLIEPEFNFETQTSRTGIRVT